MKKTPLLLIGLAAAGCGHLIDHLGLSDGPQITGSGHVKTESRNVGGFSKVRSGSIDVEVAVGGSTDLKVTADDNLLPIIKTRVEGDTLIISSEGSFSTKSKMVVVCNTPALHAAAVRGSADIQVKGVHGGNFDVAISGSGDVAVVGSASDLAVTISGSGDAKLGDLATRSAAITINGSGDALVNVAGKLTANINGSGDIRYKGHPESVSKHVNGSGSVSQG